MMDAGGKVSYWNEAAEVIFGHSSQEAIGQDLHELITTEADVKLFRQAYPEFVKSGKGPAVGITSELQGLRKNGEIFPAEIALSSVNLGGAWQAVGIVRDITVRKKSQKILLEDEKLRAALETVGMIHHELNQPLQVIMGRSEILLDEADSTSAKKDMEEIVAAAKKLSRMINKLDDIKDYKTKDYMRGSSILDLDESTKSDD